MLYVSSVEGEEIVEKGKRDEYHCRFSVESSDGKKEYGFKLSSDKFLKNAAWKRSATMAPHVRFVDGVYRVCFTPSSKNIAPGALVSYPSDCLNSDK